MNGTIPPCRYVLPDGSAGLYDWQLTLRASWARDVAYILGTSLDPAARLEHEQELLEEYLDNLRASGVVCLLTSSRLFLPVSGSQAFSGPHSFLLLFLRLSDSRS